MSSTVAASFNLNVLAAKFKTTRVIEISKEEDAPLEKRSKEELQLDAKATVNLALAGMVVGASKTRGNVLSKDKISVFKAFDEADESVKKVVENEWASALVEFAAKHGTFNDNRYWVKAGDFENGFHIFFSLPLLSQNENKSSLALSLVDEIAACIGAGLKTAPIQFVEGQGFKIIESRAKFMFPKGLHVSGFPPQARAVFQEDFKLIMKGMMEKPKGDKQGKWVWKDGEKIKFFWNGALVAEERKKEAEKAAKAAAGSSDKHDDFTV